MKITKLFLLILFCTACNDGDFNVPSFDFDNASIQNCGSVLFYKINSSGSESLILELNQDNTDDVFFKTPMTAVSYDVQPSGTNTFYYRIFTDGINGSYYCQNIPPASPRVLEEWLGSGELIINNTIAYDDNDNVASTLEDSNQDGDLTNDDLDNDGYPNYIDTDDDGDNIKTIDEDIDGDGDPSNDDTDKDGIPNYLDTDDDNDGILSINESKTADIDVDTIVDYLDPEHPENSIEAGTPATNNYQQSYTMVFEFVTLNFSSDTGEISYPNGYPLGTKTGSFTINDLPEPIENNNN